MRAALAFIVSLGVGIAVAVALRHSHYHLWEAILIGFFCVPPLFLLPFWWTERGTP